VYHQAHYHGKEHNSSNNAARFRKLHGALPPFHFLHVNAAQL
jgi:hypothetical protein